MKTLDTPEEIMENLGPLNLPLKTLVQVVNRTVNSEIAITLYVKGIVITGSLVAYEQYAKHLSQAMVPEVSKNDGTETGQVLENLINKLNSVIQNAELKDLRDSYICIKNPTVYLPQGAFTFNTFWIGKLESVDGFSLGLLTINPK